MSSRKFGPKNYTSFFWTMKKNTKRIRSVVATRNLGAKYPPFLKEMLGDLEKFWGKPQFFSQKLQEFVLNSTIFSEPFFPGDAQIFPLKKLQEFVLYNSTPCFSAQTLTQAAFPSLFRSMAEKILEVLGRRFDAWLELQNLQLGKTKGKSLQILFQCRLALIDPFVQCRFA